MKSHSLALSLTGLHDRRHDDNEVCVVSKQGARPGGTLRPPTPVPQPPSARRGVRGTPRSAAITAHR